MIRLRFGSGSNLVEPELHNFAKIFLFRADKMMIHLEFFYVIYRWSGHYLHEHHDVAISLRKLNEIELCVTVES